MVSISRRRIAFASSARASSTSTRISSCVVHSDRHERERRIRFDSGYGLAQDVGGDGLHRILAERAVP
jgi:hypothetical protein